MINEEKNVFTEYKRAIYEKASNKFTKEIQLIILMEECSELIKAVAKDLRGFSNKDEIIEEIADVSIMCEQVMLDLGIELDVCVRKNIKLERLEERIGYKEEDKGE